MLIGYPPFFADTATDTCKKILNWKECLQFPEEPKVSNEARDLITKLINDSDKRLGSNEIREHPFFNNIDFDNIQNVTPPFVPDV